MSKTLGIVFAYWSGNLKSFEEDGYIQLPFNLEKFCVHMDEKMEDLDHKLAEAERKLEVAKKSIEAACLYLKASGVTGLDPSEPERQMYFDLKEALAELARSEEVGK